MHWRVHHSQARKAFRPGSGSYAGRLISALDSDALVARLSDWLQCFGALTSP